MNLWHMCQLFSAKICLLSLIIHLFEIFDAEKIQKSSQNGYNTTTFLYSFTTNIVVIT